MGPTVVLIWLSAGRAGPAFLGDASITDTDRARLSHWAATEKVRLAEPPISSGPPHSSYDGTLVQSIEAFLDQARSAAGALEESSALELLSQVETAVLAHPELPQAAWLMAEHHQLLADVRASAGSSAEALALRARAESLEGARSPTFSDRTDDDGPTRHSAETFAVTIEGLGAGDTLEWNGLQAGAEVRADAGPHHVRVLRRGRVVFAAWAIVSGAGPLRLAVPPIVPCSADDLDGARIEGGRAQARGNTECPSWAVARPAPNGAIEIARCSRESCGPLVRVQRPETRTPAPAAGGGWPGWATYTLAGLGAAVATGLVLWQTGAFERPDPETRTSWEFQGLGNSAFRF
jgi:hypothetical protein